MMKPSTAEYQKILTEEDAEYGMLPKARPVKSRRSGSSFCKICLIITFVVFAILLTLGIATFCVMNHIISGYVKKFTVTTPVDIPVVKVDRSIVEAAKGRVEGYYEDLLHGDIPEHDLVITETEINGFFGHDDYLRGHAKLTIDDNQFRVDMSLPVDELPGGKGRYFVATAYENLNVEDQTAFLDIESKSDIEDYAFGHTLVMANVHWYMDRSNYLNVNLVKGIFFGFEAPQSYIDQHENLIEHLYECDEAAKILNSIESVKIEKGQIVIVPKRGKKHDASPRPKERHPKFLRRVLF